MQIDVTCNIRLNQNKLLYLARGGGRGGERRGKRGRERDRAERGRGNETGKMTLKFAKPIYGQFYEYKR